MSKSWVSILSFIKLKLGNVTIRTKYASTNFDKTDVHGLSSKKTEKYITNRNIEASEKYMDLTKYLQWC